MIAGRAILFLAFAVQAVPAASDGIELSDLLAKPEPLTTVAAEAPDPDVRCHSFFLAANVLWGISEPYGAARDVFDWSFDRTLFEDYTEDMRAQVQASDYVARYVETIAPDGVDPETNSQHPLYLTDKEFCISFADKTS